MVQKLVNEPSMTSKYNKYHDESGTMTYIYSRLPRDWRSLERTVVNRD